MEWKKCCQFLVGIDLLASASLTGAEKIAVPVGEPSPLLVLYEQRQEMERNELERQKTNLTYTIDLKDRVESLHTTGAIPEATVHAVRAELDMAQLRVKSQESRVRMAEAMVEIARARLGAGKEMPFCGLPQVKELNDADWELPGLLKGGAR